MTTQRIVRAAMTAAFLTAGWAGSARAEEAPRDPDKVWSFIHGLPASERRAVLETEAEKDGSLVVYGVTGLDRLQFFAAEFNKRYPNIKVDVVRLNTAEAPQRLHAEHKAGRTYADVVITGPNASTTLADLIAPYESSEWDNFDNRLRYGGFDRGWTLVAYEIFPYAFAWRTDRGLSADNTPKTFEDLADPRWKGRIGTLFSLEGVIGGLIELEGEAKAKDLLAKLARQDIRLYSSHAALADALSAGEIDLAWNLATHRTSALKSKGAPIDWRYPEPQIASANGVFLTKNSKKPFAAALFADVLLSAPLLEAYDASEPSLIYGNKTGKFANRIEDFPTLRLAPLGDVKDLREWASIKERLFVRRQQ